MNTIDYWIGATCRELRKSHKVRVNAIAAIADVDQSTINRFENGHPVHKINNMVAAYAYLCDVDGRELWAAAVKDWQAKGEAPAPALTRLGRL